MAGFDDSAFRKAWASPSGGFRQAMLDFSYAGRFRVSFGSQGFPPSDFGAKGALRAYCSSPDVWYYDADVSLDGNEAYAVALVGRTFFGSPDALDALSEALDGLFSARDPEAYAEKAGFSPGDGGSFSADLARYGLVGSLSVSPAR